MDLTILDLLKEKKKAKLTDLDPFGGYQEQLQANKAAATSGNGLIDLAQNRLAADERNPRPWLEKAALATMPVPVLGDVLGAASDVAYMAANEEARTPLNFGLSALGLLPFLPGMTAFHGSPHRINNVTPDAPLGKLDLSKIGTGEGNQAYGHGIYLAENPGVAKEYQMALSGDLDVAPEVAERLRKLPRVGNMQADGMSVLAGSAMGLQQDAPGVAKYFRDMAAKADDAEAVTYSALADAIDAGEVAAKKGHFYTVDLPDEHIEKMLDWDAPLSEQPEAVREALEQMGVRMEPPPVPYKIETRPEGVVIRSLREDGAVAYRAKSMDDAKKQLSAMQDQARETFLRQSAGRTAYEEIAEQVGPEQASQFLREAGIPGIRYLDGGSRSAGEGTRNFVIFDPDIAKIIGRE